MRSMTPAYRSRITDLALACSTLINSNQERSLLSCPPHPQDTLPTLAASLRSIALSVSAHIFTRQPGINKPNEVVKTLCKCQVKTLAKYIGFICTFLDVDSMVEAE